MLNQVHKLKISRNHADAKIAGDKMFEIRYDNDICFQKGDIVIYDEVIYKEDNESPASCILAKHPIYDKQYRITFVTSFEQKDGVVVFGEEEISGENYVPVDAFCILDGEAISSEEEDDQEPDSPIIPIGFRDTIQETKQKGGSIETMKKKDQPRILYFSYDFNFPAAGVYAASSLDLDHFPVIPKDYNLKTHSPTVVREDGGTQYYAYIYVEDVDSDKIAAALSALKDAVYKELGNIENCFRKNYNDICSAFGLR